MEKQVFQSGCLDDQNLAVFFEWDIKLRNREEYKYLKGELLSRDEYSKKFLL